MDDLEVEHVLKTFTWPDYVVFTIMLLICIFIGIYFGFIQVSKNVTDYLLGGREMNAFPVAMSMVVSFVSGIAFVGTPAEVYVYGMQYVYIIVGTLSAGVIAHLVFLPVFLDLKITSTYEYLERRFDKRTRWFGSLLFVITTLLWLPIVIYVPALALNQVTGLGVRFISPVVSLICIFYTCVGGIKAVIWTDMIQAFVMLGSIILVIIKGTINVGGPMVVWERNINSTRLEPPNFDFDPLTRHTFWSLAVGGCFFFLQSGVINQIMIQRYQSLPNWKAIRRALWICMAGMVTVIVIFSYNGLLLYATYHDCDPLTTGQAGAKDQLLPLLVMDILQDLPGFSGLFLAGIFSASLSSLSGGLNSLAAVILEDFYKPIMGDISSFHTNMLMKSVVVILGAVIVGLAFIVEKLGGVLQLAISLQSVTLGPALALFTIGVLLPWVNGKGALTGGITGLAVMSWICFGTQAAIATGQIHFATKEVSVDGCAHNTTGAYETIEKLDSGEAFILYRMSYLWYTIVGCTITMVVSLLASICTGWNKSCEVDPALLSPIIRKRMQKTS